jgi:hypothetical protein
MATPITWKNVEQSPYTTLIAGNILKGAGDSFASGVGQLQGVYDNYQKGLSQQNTAAYEAELAKYTTPEALQAAQESGVLANLGKQYGLQMDQEVLKNGLRNAQTSLRGDVTSANAYTDMKGKRLIEDPVATFARIRNDDIQNQADKVRAASDTSASSVATTQGTVNQNTEWGLNAPKREVDRNVALGAGKNTLSDQQQTVNFNQANLLLADGIRKLSSSPLTESQKILETDKLIARIGKDLNLPTSEINKLNPLATSSLNGIPLTNARTNEIIINDAMNKNITETAIKNNSFFNDGQKTYGQRGAELDAIIDKEFNPKGWRDANPDNAKLALRKYLDQTIEIDDGTGKKISIPVTVELLKDAMGLGAKDKRWLTGSATLDPNLMAEKLAEAAKKPAILKAFRVKEAIDSNNIVLLKKALGIGK